MQIEEEGKEGKKLRSVLRLPAVASSYLHALLLAFCERTYSQLALYSAPPDVQLEAIRSFFEALVSRYEEQLLVASRASSPATMTIAADTSASDANANSIDSTIGNKGDSSGNGIGSSRTRGLGRGLQALSSRQAFQLWFDLKYLRALLIPLSRLASFAPQEAPSVMTISSTIDGVADGKKTPSAPCWERLDSLVVRLEAVIDPFDLHVFLPYLQRNLRLHLHRTSVC